MDNERLKNKEPEGQGGGIAFFTKVAAVISHEFNNVLAIMQENVGLLKDYLALAEKGRELDPARLDQIAGRMKAQVVRGQEIMAAMNRFAHSGDEALSVVELGELSQLVVFLFTRPAAVLGVSWEVTAGLPDMKILTRPLVLEELLWQCLDLASRGAADGHCVLQTVMSAKGAVMEITGLATGKGEELAGLAGAELGPLLTPLGANIEPTADEQGIMIELTDLAEVGLRADA